MLSFNSSGAAAHRKVRRRLTPCVSKVMSSSVRGPCGVRRGQVWEKVHPGRRAIKDNKFVLQLLIITS